MNNKEIYLKSVARLCEKELDALNIPYAKGIAYSVNTRAPNRWGQCRYNRATKSYSINISNILVDPSTISGLKNTIIHELLHSVPNGMGHTGEWKKFATMVNNHYGYDIKRVSTSVEKGVELKNDDSSKYVFVCERCGRIIRRNRRSKFVDSPQNYRCGECDGKFKQVK